MCLLGKLYLLFLIINLTLLEQISCRVLIKLIYYYSLIIFNSSVRQNSESGGSIPIHICNANRKIS